MTSPRIGEEGTVTGDGINCSEYAGDRRNPSKVRGRRLDQRILMPSLNTLGGAGLRDPVSG